jgi:hypothetical protein
MTEEMVKGVEDSTHKIRELATLMQAEIFTLETKMASLRKQEEIVPLLVAFYNMNTVYDDQVDQVKKQMYNLVESYKKSFIPQLMRDKSLEGGVKVASIGRSFTILVKPSASILEGQKDAAFEWLRHPDRDMGGLITETVNASSLSSYLKSMSMEMGIDPPDDIFKFGYYDQVSSVKYTPKPAPTDLKS